MVNDEIYGFGVIMIQRSNNSRPPMDEINYEKLEVKIYINTMEKVMFEEISINDAKYRIV